MRTQSSSFGLMWLATMASPSSAVSSPSSCSRSSSRSGSGSSSVAGSSATGGASTDDNRLTLPACCHVLVLNALLQEHDALEQGFRARRAARHVDVDRDDLVDALGH